MRHLAEWHGGGLVGDVVTVRAVMILHVSEEGPGAVEGGVGDEEEVAGEGEERDEREEGRAQFFALLSGGREEEARVRHRWRVYKGVAGF